MQAEIRGGLHCRRWRLEHWINDSITRWTFYVQKKTFDTTDAFGFWWYFGAIVLWGRDMEKGSSSINRCTDEHARIRRTIFSQSLNLPQFYSANIDYTVSLITKIALLAPSAIYSSFYCCLNQ